MVVSAPIKSPKRGTSVEVTESLTKIYQNYLRHLKIESCTEATLSHKRRQLQPFLAWLEDQGHSLQAGELTSFDILEHLEAMKERGNAVNTIHTRLRSIRAWCNWMVTWGILEDSPCQHIKSPRLPIQGKGFLQESDFKALLDLCPMNTLLGSRRAAMLRVLISTGMRRSELWSLQLKDLDWDRNIIHIRQGKGQKERWAPFRQEAQRAMLRYLHHRKDDYPCVWISEEGKPIKSDQIGMDLRRLMQRAGVEVKDCCHIFRRTWAANAERKHIPRPYIQAIAGWSTPQMLDRYVKAMQQGEEAIDAFKDFEGF